ncbi:hypothetical protein B0H10DRAFT_2235590 [Mycena sp. CBHHK59/15]|nr:hypothetical protein B0H10DRAFT_2235590 [Mycena sp. CBHHK59/15]
MIRVDVEDRPAPLSNNTLSPLSESVHLPAPELDTVYPASLLLSPILPAQIVTKAQVYKMKLLEKQIAFRWTFEVDKTRHKPASNSQSALHV